FASFRSLAPHSMPRNSAPSLRQVYDEWVEEQIEEYKDSVPRDDLLRLAEEVCEELRVSGGGQYQLTEILLCDAVDRKIASLMKLPTYRSWRTTRRAAAKPYFPLDLPIQRSSRNEAEAEQ